MCIFPAFSYDVIFLGDLSTIVERFLDTDARVLFSAEAYCWPDKSLATQYPPVSRGKRYLNSGGFIGYATDVYKILETAVIKDEDDDQLFYTTVYLQDELRLRHKIKLDHKSEIFQNLYGAVGKGKRNPQQRASIYINRILFSQPSMSKINFVRCLLQILSIKFDSHSIISFDVSIQWQIYNKIY